MTAPTGLMLIAETIGNNLNIIYFSVFIMIFQSIDLTRT